MDEDRWWYIAGRTSSGDCQIVQTLLKVWLLVGSGWVGVVEEQIAASEALGLADPRGVAAASANKSRCCPFLSLPCG